MTPRYEPDRGKYTVETEKVNSLPVVISTLIKMGVREIIDRYHQPHGNWQGISAGWLVVMWLGYILTERDHKLVSVEEWAMKHQQTLEQLTGQELRREDFTDDRLGTVLKYLSKDKLWLGVEEELGQRLVRVYELETGEVRRLDATVGGGKHKESELFKRGRNKQGQYEVQFKLMMGVLDPMGLALATEVVSGEQADDGLYGPIYQRIGQMLGPGGKLYVGDSKLSAVGNRVLFVLGGDYYLTPLALVGQRGELLAELLEMVHRGQVELGSVYFPEDIPVDPEQVPEPKQAIAAGFEVIREEQTNGPDGRLVTWTERLLVIRSHAFAQAQQLAFEQKLDRAEVKLLALTPKPGRGKRQFDDLVALQGAVEKIMKQEGVTAYFEVKIERLINQRQVRAYGQRPARVEEKVRYKLLVTRRQKVIEQAKFGLGWRLYASNAPAKLFDLTKLVLTYRDQYLAERPFARLKGTLLKLLPLYVQRDDHAKGLIRVLTIGLRALTIIEFVVRRALAQHGQKLVGLYSGNPKRQTARPSVELLLQAFDDINLSIILNSAGQIEALSLTPLNPLQRQILTLLDMSTDIYEGLVGWSVQWPVRLMVAQPTVLVTS